ncbi:MAG: hypothetical protein WBG71_02410 [Leeuwenhoekiella sp.]
MKRIFTILALAIFTTSITACRETEEKTVIREVEVESEEAEGVLERTAKEVDKEVNEEIDEEIDNIGDDN